MRISNPPKPAISTSLLFTVGMNPEREAAIDFYFTVYSDSHRRVKAHSTARNSMHTGEPTLTV